MAATAWYQDGLRFACTKCGNCCTGSPGFTWVSEDEIDRLSVRLGLDREAFIRKYTRSVWRQGEERRSLVEHRRGDCVFWVSGTGCTVYEDRPRQCRTWPFWRSNLAEADDWAAAARACPGMDRGPLHAAAEIAAVAADDGLP
jgi:Fe-S-cluster containining protein